MTRQRRTVAERQAIISAARQRAKGWAEALGYAPAIQVRIAGMPDGPFWSAYKVVRNDFRDWERRQQLALWAVDDD